MQNQAERTEEKLIEFEGAFQIDYQYFRAEILVNHAHCEALFHAGILTRLESERIKNGLQTIIKRAEYDKNYFNESGDVHSFVAARLEQLVGESGKKLRIGRSEIEHEITTVRFWLRGEIEEISILIKRFQSELITSGENQRNIIFPVTAGFDKKQIVLWAHWCLARFEMLERDKERLEEVWRRVSVSAFGAETCFEIDREEIAATLKFEGVSSNSLDAVSDLDFAIEFCSACSLLMLHLVRLAEETTNCLSKEFGLLEFKGKHKFVQEQNLNYLDSLRRYATRISGYQSTLFLLNRTFTLGSDKNFREEVKTLSDMIDTVKFCLKAISLVFKDITVNEFKASQSAAESFPINAEITDYLLKKDVSFEVANETANNIIEFAATKRKQIKELNLNELQNFSPTIDNDVYQVLRIEEALAGKNQIGGTAPERVCEALDAAKKSLEREEIYAKA